MVELLSYLITSRANMLHVFPALLEAKGRRAVVASVWPASKVGPDHFSVSLWSVFNKHNQLLFQLWGVWLPKLILPVKRSVLGVYKAEFSDAAASCPVRQVPTWQRGYHSDFDPGNHKCPTSLVFTALAYRFCKLFTTHSQQQICSLWQRDKTKWRQGSVPC